MSHDEENNEPGPFEGEASYASPTQDRLMEEINILRLEGRLFCFDPRQAKRQSDPITFGDGNRPPMEIAPHPHYGRPSVLAYKVLQAIFLKMTEEGYPYPDTVSFSQRELARLVGRSVFGGNQSRQLYEAIMQLHTTRVACSFYDKETKEWGLGTFYVLPRALFSGRSKAIKECLVRIDDTIVNSVNKRHVAFFNLHRLHALDTVGMVLYKRVFFHFSNLNHRNKPREALSFEKDYESICQEWLGGLKPERYKSRILQNQLGRHLEGLRRTRLIRKYEVERRAGGTGFKLVFYPGQGFFDDYQAYYLEKQQPRLRFNQTASLRYIQQPLELVAYFHKLLDREHTTFQEKETAYASELLEQHGFNEMRDLIEYAVGEARSTNFAMQVFGALKQYVPRWQADRKRRHMRQERQEAIDACPLCDEGGHFILKDHTGAFAAHPCPHDAERIGALEDRTGLRRV